MAKKRTLASFIAQNRIRTPKALKIKPMKLPKLKPYQFKSRIKI
jgi:hypothetical protein